MEENELAGPRPGAEAGVQALAPGVWLTTGRTAVVEGADRLAVIDPGDELAGSVSNPCGPLADTLELSSRLGKPVEWLVLTHGHRDHVANLGVFRQLFPGAQVVAHANSPCAPDRPVTEEVELPGLGGMRLLSVPGHSPWGDDLALHLHGVLFSGDLLQPKGETWEQAFYPSPYPYFIDGQTYLSSLERLGQLDFWLLVTGHREVRRGPAAHKWLELTHRAIRRVAEAVRDWEGPAELSLAAPQIWRKLADERGIPTQQQEARLNRGSGPSTFENFDLPGIAYFWNRLRVAR